jgi:hypothetical protein
VEPENYDAIHFVSNLLVETSYRALTITQDLGLGMMSGGPRSEVAQKATAS